MEDMSRRTMLALGVAATPALALPRSAAADTYGPNEGKEKAPGVRQVDLGQREAIIPGYKTVSMRDIVVQPGAVIPKDTMPNAMVCHITEGGLRVMQNDTEFRVKKGDVWTCATGTTEQAWNEGNGVAVMRITDLLSA
jgi:quercetin dioxygenase-like cupin family protein